MNIITMVIAEHEGQECRQLDKGEHLFPANCSKVWLNNIDKTLMYALRQNRNFEHVIRNLNKPFHSIANHCSYKRWVQWDDNRLRHMDRTLCGISMIINNHPNLKLDVQERMLITVDAFCTEYYIYVLIVVHTLKLGQYLSTVMEPATPSQSKGFVAIDILGRLLSHHIGWLFMCYVHD